MGMETYVIAVKRERRRSVPADWMARIIGQTSGLQILSGNSRRVQVRASDEAIKSVRSHWGHLLHIEKHLLHAPQSAWSLSE